MGKGQVFMEKSWIPPSAFHACQGFLCNFLLLHPLHPSECNIEEGTKLSGHNLYPLGAETQEECSVACLREPECHFWTHNPNIGRCWLKKSDLGKGPSSKGSNSGQKSCGVTGGICLLENAFMEFLFQKTTSSLAVSLKMAVTAPREQQKVVEWLL